MVDSSPTSSEQARSMQPQVPESDPPPYTTTTATATPLRSTQPGNSSTTTTTTTASPAIASTTTTTTKNQPLSWFKSLVKFFSRSPESIESRRRKKSRRQYSQRIRARERELRTRREGTPSFFVGPPGSTATC
ncbi:uncharacterized protein BDW47DRAFT_25021 [Aspergillus candidus]|uniref:Uncharacterized protein n=1 Tax=Aspergillus candidus TaxID=41067 RepID=A0A2I2FNA7_ASPCN|nr:hypothetical protein BDW47DRAFT_25021 [Aspergillus candidus]PLB42113.1 hypothetical protein BDW47DRAFT_25021 [Aspergillus candidus]